MGGNVAGMLRLVLVTDDALVGGRDLPDLCRAAVRGGVTAVQLRLKQATPRDLCTLARTLREALPVPLFINDRVDVALAAGADGVHLGPDDLPVRLARSVVPAGFLLGASVGGPDEIPGGVEADYWGVGPYRVTTTKADAGAALGPEGLAAVVRESAGHPCVAIGGIRPDDVPAVLRAGACGVAVVSGILGGESGVEQAAAAYAAGFR